MFQFQYGSIKSKKGHPIVLPDKLFQFQYGSIKSSSAVSMYAFLILFQFQYGSIKRKKTNEDGTKTTLVSIPIWFD